MTAVELGAERAALAAAARRLAAEGVAPATAGNLSARRADRVAITGGGVRLSEMTADACVVVDADGVVTDGRGRPSSETPLHLAAYAATGTSAIAHSHAAYATALGSVLTGELPVVHYAMAQFGGPVRIAPYARFGSDDLAAHVAAALDGRRAALMANHGAVTIGATIEEAVERMVVLEWLCAVTHHALTLGTPRLVGADELREVAEESRRRRYGVPSV
jgi:L-fuculose-phosphate aldolase